MKLNTKALAEVEIGIPIIVDGLYHARIEKPAKGFVQPNKRGDGNNLVVQFRILDNPVVLRKEGKEIVNNGQIVNTRWFSLVPSADYDPDKAMKELALAIRHPAEKDLADEDLEGKIVMVKMEYREEQAADAANNKKAFPAGNEIKRVTPVPEDDTFSPPPF